MRHDDLGQRWDECSDMCSHIARFRGYPQSRSAAVRGTCTLPPSCARSCAHPVSSAYWANTQHAWPHAGQTVRVHTKPLVRDARARAVQLASGAHLAETGERRSENAASRSGSSIQREGISTFVYGISWPRASAMERRTAWRTTRPAARRRAQLLLSLCMQQN